MGNLAYHVKALATKPNCLHLIPHTYMVERIDFYNLSSEVYSSIMTRLAVVGAH